MIKFKIKDALGSIIFYDNFEINFKSSDNSLGMVQR